MCNFFKCDFNYAIPRKKIETTVIILIYKNAISIDLKFKTNRMF